MPARSLGLRGDACIVSRLSATAPAESPAPPHPCRRRLLPPVTCAGHACMPKHPLTRVSSSRTPCLQQIETMTRVMQVLELALPLLVLLAPAVSRRLPPLTLKRLKMSPRPPGYTC